LKKHSEGKFDPQVFIDADMIVVGEPDKCIEKMRRYADLGVDRLLCYVQFGYLPHESVVNTIKLLGKHVIPELENAGIETTVRPEGDAAVRELGSGDGLVDIVGMAKYTSILDTTDEEYDWTFDVVLRHAYLYSQACGRVMSDAGGGTMVFVASVSGITAAPRHAAYGAAKAALMAWIRSLAVELGPSNVRANGVAPGLVWTPRISEYLGDEGRALNVDN